MTWISCGDSLPEPNVTVLLVYKGTSVFTGRRQIVVCHGWRWIVGGLHQSQETVSHWMPLPPLPPLPTMETK